MILQFLLLIPFSGAIMVVFTRAKNSLATNLKSIALNTSILNLFMGLIVFILYNFSTNQFQFVLERYDLNYLDFYLGLDGTSIYFVLLTTIIIPIALLSNWTSIIEDIKLYLVLILLLETLLVMVFLVLDSLLFYIFFESILPPLFLVIGMFGSDDRMKASFYLFLYTLLGSLFLLLCIIAMSNLMSTTDFDTLFKSNFLFITQLFLFCGVFIAFAVKTPTIFLNTWLLRAHVESPLGGSIILAAIVLKLSLYGILRLILPLLPKGYMEYTYLIFAIGVVTIIYASLSTLRTIDVKELIAYSSVSHAAVYLLGLFSNTIQGIAGAISLGLAHGFVSPGLFICAGGVLYDRSHTRVISFYRGMAQIMPIFAIVFFILCLANCGAPLSLNFIGEFLSLYGVFERSTLFGTLAGCSIIFSAGYTIYMYQKISFGGSYSKMFTVNIPDVNYREFSTLLILVIATILFGIYPAPILDGINYSVSTLLYYYDGNISTFNTIEFLTLIIFSRPFSSNIKFNFNDSPKPYAFTNLPLQSKAPEPRSREDEEMYDVPSGESDDEGESASSDPAPAENCDREYIIDEYRNWLEELEALKDIANKSENEVTEEERNQWNIAVDDKNNDNLYRDHYNAGNLEKEIRETKDRIKAYKDELKDPANEYEYPEEISSDDDSDSEFFFFILPVNFPIISIIFIFIRNKYIFILSKLYLTGFFSKLKRYFKKGFNVSILGNLPIIMNFSICKSTMSILLNTGIVIFFGLLIVTLKLDIIFSISAIFCIIIIINFIFLIRQNLHNSNLVVCLCSICSCSIGLKLLHNYITWETVSGLQPIHVFLLYVGIALMIMNILVYEKNKICFFHIVDFIHRIFILLKRRPIYYSFISLCYLILLILMQLTCNCIGLTIITNTWFLYFTSLYSRLVFFKLIFCIVMFLCTENKQKCYSSLTLSPLAILAMVPISVFWFYLLLPNLLVFNVRTIYNIDVISNKLSSLFNFVFNDINSILNYFYNKTINVFFLFIVVIKKFSLYLITLHNRPADVGKLLNYLTDWVLNKDLSFNKRPFVMANYTSLKLLDPVLVNMHYKIRHWNFMKSLPRISPVKITIPLPSKGNFDSFIYVKGSLSNLYKHVYTNYIELLDTLKQLNNTKIKLYFPEENLGVAIEIQGNKIDFKVTDNNQKSFFRDSVFMSKWFKYEPALPECHSLLRQSNDYVNKLLRLTTPNKNDTNLTVNMQRLVRENTSYRNSSTQPSFIHDRSGETTFMHWNPVHRMVSESPVIQGNLVRSNVPSNNIINNNRAHNEEPNLISFGNINITDRVFDTHIKALIDRFGDHDLLYPNILSEIEKNNLVLQNTINRYDFTNPNYPLSIYLKINNLRDLVISRFANIKTLPFSNKSVELYFYRSMELINNLGRKAESISDLSHNLFIDVRWFLITERDFTYDTDSYGIYVIEPIKVYNKINNCINKGYLDKNMSIFRLMFEYGAVSSAFYKSLANSLLINCSGETDPTIDNLLDSLKIYLIRDYESFYSVSINDYVNNPDKDSFINDKSKLNYSSIYSKIQVMIQLNIISETNHVSNLLVEPPYLKNCILTTLSKALSVHDAGNLDIKTFRWSIMGLVETNRSTNWNRVNPSNSNLINNSNLIRPILHLQ